MKLFVRLLLILIVLGGAGAAVWYYYLQPKPEIAPSTTEVIRGDIEETVLASGTINAKTLVSVGADVSGTINSVHVQLGDQVKKGDLIAEIDSLNQENALKQTNAALAIIQAQRRIQAANQHNAQLALDRATQLRAQNLVSEADFNTAQVAVEIAQAQLDAIDAQIDQANLNVDSANLNLSRTKITAPIDGTIVAVLVDVGQTVNANQQAPTIVKLADLSTMIVKAGISEADVPNVMPGQPAFFTILGQPDKKIPAKLVSIEPAPSSIATDTGSTASNSTAIYYNGNLEVPNPDGLLRISMTAQITIVTRQAKDALLIPASALGPAGQGGKYSVETYDPATGDRQRRRVTIGINNKIMAEVLDGLKEGDNVISSSTRTQSLGTTGGGRRPGGGSTFLGIGGRGR